jgi:hypothetical protein
MSRFATRVSDEWACEVQHFQVNTKLSIAEASQGGRGERGCTLLDNSPSRMQI